MGLQLLQVSRSMFVNVKSIVMPFQVGWFEHLWPVKMLGVCCGWASLMSWYQNVPNLSGAPPGINFWGYDLQSLEDAFWNQYGPRKGVTNFVAGKFSGCAKSPPGIATLPQPFGSSWLYTTVVVLDLMTIYMPVQFLPTVELGRGHDIPCYIIRSNSPTQ